MQNAGISLGSGDFTNEQRKVKQVLYHCENTLEMINKRIYNANQKYATFNTYFCREINDA